MKKKLCFGLVFVLVASLVTALPLWAVSIGNSTIKLNVSGPVSVKAGQTTTLHVTATTKESYEVYCASLQAVVIDPWTGTRILGPSTISVKQLVDSTGINVPVSLNIPKSLPPVPGANASLANKTLAVVIYALDDNQTVIGTIGWGFVTTP